MPRSQRILHNMTGLDTKKSTLARLPRFAFFASHAYRTSQTPYEAADVVGTVAGSGQYDIRNARPSISAGQPSARDGPAGSPALCVAVGQDVSRSADATPPCSPSRHASQDSPPGIRPAHMVVHGSGWCPFISVICSFSVLIHSSLQVVIW
jgi:hypothetical protein